jgi:hypothetical protein
MGQGAPSGRWQAPRGVYWLTKLCGGKAFGWSGPARRDLDRGGARGSILLPVPDDRFSARLRSAEPPETVLLPGAEPGSTAARTSQLTCSVVPRAHRGAEPAGSVIHDEYQ